MKRLVSSVSRIPFVIVATFFASGVLLVPPLLPANSGDLPTLASHTQGQTEQTLSLLNDIDCPSTTVCYVVGAYSGGTGAIFATQDGGADWSGQTVPSGIATLIGITCFSTTDCYASGDTTSGGAAFLTTTDGGTKWATGNAPSKVSSFGSITCPTTSICYITATESAEPKQAYVSVTTDEGATWHTKFIGGGGRQSLDGITCTSDETCFAVGSATYYGSNKAQTAAHLGRGGFQPISSNAILRETTNGGRTWVYKAVSDDLEWLGGIACPLATVCLASGYAYGPAGFEVSKNSGESWNFVEPSEQDAMAAIACPGSHLCYSAGFGGKNDGNRVLVTSNVGKTWTKQSVAGDGRLDSISCPSTNTCFAAGIETDKEGFGQVATTVDGGSVWTLQQVPSS
jgi:photosystem II stability/assembly factor-like uncharacterized protein